MTKTAALNGQSYDLYQGAGDQRTIEQLFGDNPGPAIHRSPGTLNLAGHIEPGRIRQLHTQGRIGKVLNAPTPAFPDVVINALPHFHWSDEFRTPEESILFSAARREARTAFTILSPTTIQSYVEQLEVFLDEVDGHSRIAISTMDFIEKLSAILDGWNKLDERGKFHALRTAHGEFISRLTSEGRIVSEQILNLSKNFEAALESEDLLNSHEHTEGSWLINSPYVWHWRMIQEPEAIWRQDNPLYHCSRSIRLGISRL